jgi:ubiquinone/menaquinone biosynthesis C-methylase UbiE
MQAHETRMTRSSYRGAVIDWARRYDLLVGLLALGRVSRMYGKLLAPAHLSAGESLLDVGCGTGSLVRVAQKVVGERAAGVDASPAMIARARNKVPGARFEVGYAQELPFPDARFDVVVNTLMLHHLPRADRQEAIAEMRRVLKPGGRLLTVDFVPASEKRGIVARLHGRGGGVQPRAIEELVRGAGFEVLESGPAKVLELQFVLAQRPVDQTAETA